MLHARNGFTLLELLIVVVILGVLASIAIPKFANTKEKAYIAQMESDLRNLVTAEEAFYADSSTYTATTAKLRFLNGANVSVPAITLGTGNWHGTVTHNRIASPFLCGVGVNTTNPVVATAIEGEPACQ